jgi:hypothetical protein
MVIPRRWLRSAVAAGACRALGAEGRRALDPRRLALGSVRLGLVASGSYLLQLAHSTFWSQGDGMWNPMAVVLSFSSYGLAFCLLGAGVAARRPRRWLPLVLLAFLLGTTGSCYVTAKAQRPGAAIPDLVVLSSYSAELLLLGENPYAWDMGDAYSTFRASGFFMTPLLDGSSTSVLPYPSLHFLALVPLQPFGLEGARALYVLCHTLAGTLLFLRAPGSLRAVVLLPLWVSAEYLGFALNFVTDSVWALLLLCSIFAWRHRGWRAVFYGLACSYKQVPWLLAPFILIRLLIDDEDPDPRPPLVRALAFFGIAGALFATLNGPFMLADFPAWAAAVFQPLTGHLVYLGAGLASVTQLGLVELPKPFYATASLLVMATLALLYAAHFRSWRHTLWLFPGLVLWFSYRSLQSYFAYWVPLLMAVVVTEAAERRGVPVAAAPAEPRSPGGPWDVFNRLPLRTARWAQARRRWTAGVVAACVCTTLFSAAYFLQTFESVAVELVEARLHSSADIGDMVVLVHNTTDTTLMPRFAVQRTSWQPFPWDIVSGAPSLAPGQSDRYRIRTDLPYRTLPLAEGGQLVVSEATGSYRVRGTLEIAPDDSFLDPGAIFNSRYLVSSDGAGVPWGWMLQRATDEDPSIEYARTADGSRAIQLGFRANPDSREWEGVGIAQGVLFPDADIRLWVKPEDRGPDDETALTTAYGLELHDAQRRLWVLFSPSKPSEGYLAPDHYYIRRWLPAGAWSEQEVDLRAIYARLGWPLPPLKRTVRGNVELVTRGTSLTLFVAARNRLHAERFTAQFGPARIEPGTDAIRRRIRERVERRAEYDQALSDLEEGRRNVDRARELREKAAQSRPD